MAKRDHRPRASEIFAVARPVWKIEKELDVDKFHAFSSKALRFSAICLLSLILSVQVYGDGQDTDGDGLPDVWETSGVDIDNDGVIDFIPFAADPMRKNVYLEIDYMQGHRPDLQVINDLRAAFENAPVENPDGSQGISLHIEVDDQIAHQDLTSGEEFFDIRLAEFGNAAERALDDNPFLDSNVIEAKQLVYHYAIFAHQMKEDPERSGGSYSSNTFVVTLGHARWGKHPITGHNIGSIDQKAGTLMHELGHSLGLNHGGGDGKNCKPNYLSVMSYSRQFSNPIADRPLDYSRSELNSLNENALSEAQGIEVSSPPGLTTVHGPFYLFQTVTGIPIDWSEDGDTNELFQPADANYLTTISECGESPGEILQGHDDWDSLNYRLQKAQEYMQRRELHIAGSLSQRQTDLQIRSFSKSKFQEISINDVRGFRILLLRDLHSALRKMPNSLFGQYKERNAKEFFISRTDPRSSKLRRLLLANNIGKAILELSNIKSKFKDVSKASAKTYPDRSSIESRIDNLVGVLRKSQ